MDFRKHTLTGFSQAKKYLPESKRLIVVKRQPKKKRESE